LGEKRELEGGILKADSKFFFKKAKLKLKFLKKAKSQIAKHSLKG